MFNKLMGAALAVVQYMKKDVTEVAADLGNVAREAGAKALALVTAVGMAAGSAVQDAHAAVPASVSTAFTEMEADFESVFGFAFAVLVTITVAMIAWRYTKKLGNRL